MASGLRQSYTLGSSVGSGSYADVWLAHRKNDASAAYAIKISSSQKGLQHARNEAAMMRRVAHPNALQLIEVGDTEDEVAVVTPYIDGGNLLDYLRNSNCLHEDHARSIFLQLVGVLHHAHLNGVVHRDIKLENILISKDGKTVYLADWGFAGEWKAGKLQTHPYGSLHYCAPEIVRGAPYFGPEVDIWSLGVVLYALNSAKLPFRGETPRKIHKRILVAEPSYPAHFSPSLIALVSAMLNPDRSLRATIPEILESAWVVEGGVTPELLAATTLAVARTEPAAHCIDTAEALALARQEQARLEEAALRRNGGARSPFPAQLS